MINYSTLGRQIFYILIVPAFKVNAKERFILSITRRKIRNAVKVLTEAIKTVEGKQIINELHVKFEFTNERNVKSIESVDVSEEWRDIAGFNGDYQISNFGRVRSCKIGNEWRMLRPGTNERGYKHVALCDGSGKRIECKIHRLVAAAFLTNPENLPEVEHRDDNPANNHVSNLFWSTHSENMKHAAQTGRMKRIVGLKNPSSKLTAAQVRYIRNHYKPHDPVFSGAALGRKFNLSLTKNSLITVK